MRTYREDLKECLDRNEGQNEYLSRLMVANTVYDEYRRIGYRLKERKRKNGKFDKAN